jgi:hypothetical protein
LPPADDDTADLSALSPREQYKATIMCTRRSHAEASWPPHRVTKALLGPLNAMYVIDALVTTLDTAIDGVAARVAATPASQLPSDPASFSEQ